MLKNKLKASDKEVEKKKIEEDIEKLEKQVNFLNIVICRGKTCTDKLS